MGYGTALLHATETEAVARGFGQSVFIGPQREVRHRDRNRGHGETTVVG